MSEVVEAGRRRTTVVGRRRSLSEQTQAAGRGLPVKGQAHAEFTRRASGFVRGSLAVRLTTERVGKTRYLVLDCTKCVLSWYRNADDALKNYDEPEGSCLVIGELQRLASSELMPPNRYCVAIHVPLHSTTTTNLVESDSGGLAKSLSEVLNPPSPSLKAAGGRV